MAKRIFISFDYDNDRNYRYLLAALKANSNSSIDFIDATPGEIQSSDVARIRSVLTQKIRASTHVLAIVGASANSYHRDRLLIGARNWQWWEIQKGKDEGKRLIGVKISRFYDSPLPLQNAGAKWALSFNVPAILVAINSTY